MWSCFLLRSEVELEALERLGVVEQRDFVGQNGEFMRSPRGEVAESSRCARGARRGWNKSAPCRGAGAAGSGARRCGARHRAPSTQRRVARGPGGPRVGLDGGDDRRAARPAPAPESASACAKLRSQLAASRRLFGDEHHAAAVVRSLVGEDASRRAPSAASSGSRRAARGSATSPQPSRTTWMTSWRLARSPLLDELRQQHQERIGRRLLGARLVEARHAVEVRHLVGRRRARRACARRCSRPGAPSWRRRPRPPSRCRRPRRGARDRSARASRPARPASRSAKSVDAVEAEEGRVPVGVRGRRPRAADRAACAAPRPRRAPADRPPRARAASAPSTAPASWRGLGGEQPARSSALVAGAQQPLGDQRGAAPPSSARRDRRRYAQRHAARLGQAHQRAHHRVGRRAVGARQQPIAQASIAGGLRGVGVACARAPLDVGAEAGAMAAGLDEAARARRGGASS